MKVQKIWALLVGIVSSTVGILRLIGIVNIPLPDAIIHITTGAIFIGGAFIKSGKFIRATNILLGIFYVVFGVVGNYNWPHMILGVLSVLIGLLVKL